VKAGLDDEGLWMQSAGWSIPMKWRMRMIRLFGIGRMEGLVVVPLKY
jgi:hypothetical protein